MSCSAADVWDAAVVMMIALGQSENSSSRAFLAPTTAQITRGLPYIVKNASEPPARILPRCIEPEVQGFKALDFGMYGVGLFRVWDTLQDPRDAWVQGVQFECMGGPEGAQCPKP